MTETTLTQTRIMVIVKDLLGLDAEQLSPDANIQQDLKADSLDQVEIMMACEEEFALEIRDEEAQPLKTIGDIIRFVDAKLAKKTH